ncbi:hypothetical protein [Deinococcus planocerae]|uniref:hypothetical protein n=1 Tax=Deinococcus planocerae TaxID=1737569 RepID=UPI000C7F6313|nr:hypothetical protein [Deinococcus planocerae]
MSGLPLADVPATRVHAGALSRLEGALPLLATLIEVGLLPALPPKRRETIHAYLRRVNGTPGALECGWRNLHLTWYEETGDGGQAEEARGVHELVLTLVHAPQCAAFSCIVARRALHRLHPYLLGSILANLSLFTRSTWSVYTAIDALEDAETFEHEGSVKGFWQDVHAELRKELGRSPTRAEVVREARGRCTPPGDLLRLIGMTEALPAVSKKYRLSPEELLEVARKHTGLWAERVAIIAGALIALRDIDQTVYALLGDEDLAATCARGEYRRNPTVILSGQGRRTSSGYLNAVQERLEETWQFAAQTEGFMNNLLIRIHTPEDAERAVQLVRLYRDAERHLETVTDLIIDTDD